MNRYDGAKTVSILGVLGNLFLFFIKIVVGIASNSQAMIADAANSATDIFASLMSFIGNRIASEPGDNSHNFGHGKAEYIFSLFISLSMVFLSAKLLYDAIINLISQSVFTFSWFLVVVCIITILVKLSLYVHAKVILKNNYNILISATMQDHRNDCIITSSTLISILFSFIQIYWLDSIVGIGISIWIFYTGIKLFIESYNILMDVSIDSQTQSLIMDIINNYPDIKKLDNISSTPVGYQYMVVVTICLDGNMSTFDSHKIADDLEKEIDKKIDEVYLTVIHVNPI